MPANGSTKKASKKTAKTGAKGKGKGKSQTKAKSKGKGESVLTEPKGKGKGKSQAKQQTEAPKAPEKISVNLIQMGSGEGPVELSEGATVNDLLVEVGLSRKDGTVLVNNQPASGEEVLPAGATVVFATKIQGGRS